MGSNKKRSSAYSSENMENKKKKKPKMNADVTSSSLPELPLNYFTDLASPDASVREAAAASLVTRLQEIHKQYETLPDKESIDRGLMLEAEKNDGLDNCAPHLRFALRKVIRGVSSSRDVYFLSFSLRISVESLLKLVSDNLSVSSSLKGQDVKESLLGRLFAYGALARSGRLIEDWQTDKDSQIIKEFTNDLISLAAKKRYLQEPGVHVLLDFIEKLPIEAVVTHVVEALKLHKWFEQATELLPVPFSSSMFFSEDHLSVIGNCFKESTFCQPRVHSLWSIIRDMLLPEAAVNVSSAHSSKTLKRNRKPNPIEEEATNNIRSFCENFMEGGLFTSSHDRKHLALDILLLLLPKLPARFLQHFLSFKFVQCLMDTLSAKYSWLHKVATHFLMELMDWVKGDDTKRVAVTMALQRHSEGKFDNITRTKTVKDLAGEFDTEDGCTLFLQSLMNLFVDEQHVPEETGDVQRSWIIESLPGVLKHVKLAPEAKLRVQKQIMKFLAVQGLFVASLGTEVTSFELQEKFKWPETATPASLCSCALNSFSYFCQTLRRLKLLWSSLMMILFPTS
ncbi:hypothetical protein F2Q68_00012558 [Brassica cretica]|uniref:Uncharacterized protein n=1 Tax=Brassica cretica TaxID=69181 RepID=A0A8S9KX23_BRACR|nr:hypothetical protein F2Q68_00012558 [Brassica cretica]